MLLLFLHSGGESENNAPVVKQLRGEYEQFFFSYIASFLDSVSYTHLTLPTNREV